MTIMQLLMLGASAFFAFKIYEHIQTLQDPEDDKSNATPADSQAPTRTAEAFSTFDSSSLVEKADAAREKGDLQKALAIYSESNIKAPNNAEVLFKMGYTLVQDNRDEEALEYFEDSIAIDNQNPFAYVEMANIFKRQGDTKNEEIMRNYAIAIDESFKEA